MRVRSLFLVLLIGLLSLFSGVANAQDAAELIEPCDYTGIQVIIVQEPVQIFEDVVFGSPSFTTQANTVMRVNPGCYTGDIPGVDVTYYSITALNQNIVAYGVALTRDYGGYFVSRVDLRNAGISVVDGVADDEGEPTGGRGGEADDEVVTTPPPGDGDDFAECPFVSTVDSVGYSGDTASLDHTATHEVQVTAGDSSAQISSFTLNSTHSGVIYVTGWSAATGAQAKILIFGAGNTTFTAAGQGWSHMYDARATVAVCVDGEISDDPTTIAAHLSTYLGRYRPDVTIVP